MQTLVLIPAYNEEAHVGKVVEAVVAQGYDCLVIDDGSQDQTAKAAAAAGARVVQNRRNIGLGRTIRRGYQEALAAGAEVVVQLDADGQYDAKEIPAVIAPIVEGQADMVLGSRLDDLRYKMPAIKKFGNRAFTWVLRRLTGADVRDGQTGFRALHREVLEHCLPINEFSYTQEMIIRVAKEKFRIVSVPIQFYSRYDGESRLFGSPFGFAVKGWWIILRTWRDYHPFRFFIGPAVILLLGAMVAAGVVVDHVLTTGHLQGRLGTLITSGVLLLFSVQLMLIGLLADMVRTHTKY
ncbi:MAG: glycosyltransferase family 2 protein [Thermoplasmatota archaeon]